MNKTYLVEELFEDIPGDPNNVIFKIPPEICESQGWGEGDTINFKVEDGVMIMKKIDSQTQTDQDLAYQEYDAFVKKMEETYPTMFTQSYGGIAVEAGWWPIIASLCASIQHHIDWKNRQSEVVPQVTVTQIKEKFGGLRFYYDGGDDEISGMVTMAAAWASHACEECGASGVLRHGGWLKTLCDTHHNLRESRKQLGV